MTAERRAVSALGLALALCGCVPEEGAPGEDAPELHTVRRGPIDLTIREAGELEAARTTVLTSQVQGRATLIYLVPEGSRVEKGQLVAQLDVSEYRDDYAERLISLEKARADVVAAEQSLAIQLAEIRAAEEEARSGVELARMELEKFLGRGRPAGASASNPAGTNAAMLEQLETLVKGTAYAHLPDVVRTQLFIEPQDTTRDMGEMAQEILRQIDAIRLARSNFELAEDTFEHSLRLAEKDYVTRNELDKDRLARDSQASRVQLAWNQLDILISYTLKKRRIELVQAYENARLELERVIATNKARKAREEADFKAKKAHFKLYEERVGHYRRQIERAEIRAPTPGLVVYARMGRGYRREPVQEGVTIRERQPIVILPDISRMDVVVKIQEADAPKVKPGQKATILVDAFPGRRFEGEVRYVAPLPDSAERWTSNDLKVYRVRLALAGTHRDLRPGMSATVEIHVGRTDALHVPLEAICYDREVPYVWVESRDGPEARAVDLGDANLEFVVVESGLTEGERIYLEVPPGVQPPRFPQPDDIPPASPEEIERANRGQAADASASRRRKGGGIRELAARLREKLIEKRPDLAEELRANPTGAMRDPRVREAIQADDELRELSRRLFESMRSRFEGERRTRRGFSGARDPSGGDGR